MLDLYQILDTTESRFNFMKGLIRIAKADGTIAKEEITTFNNLGKSMGLDEFTMNELNKLIKSNESFTITFEKKEQKLAFLIEALQLCYIDGHYTDDERTELDNIAHELNISNDALIEIEKWVIDGIEWSKKVNHLFTLE